MQKRTLAYVACLAVALLICPVSSELIMAYSVQRHGARNVLPKSAVLTENDAAGGPTLLPAGQQMCYEAGLAFNKRYISQRTCGGSPPTCLSEPGHEQYGVINTPGVGFHNYNSFANSSALDRAIMSGNSFLAGVFPKATTKNNNISMENVPIYSIADSEDWRIRGYSKCPAYQQRLSAWLKSDAFRQKEQETAALRAKVQALASQLNTSLAQWWDVYDSFNVWRTYGVGNPMPKIDDATFAQVVDVAMWLETSKMDPELTGNLLGGGLLGDILNRMATVEQVHQSNNQAPHYKLLTVSSHYNTQLGLLSALQASVPADQRTQYLWMSKIPALASVLVFELHKGSDGQMAVRVVYQNGPKAQYNVLPLPCAQTGDVAEVIAGPAEVIAGPGSCTLEAFRQLAEPQAFFSVGEWCKACNNNKVMACTVQNMERQLKEVGVDPQVAKEGAIQKVSMGSGRSVSPAMVVVWCVVSVVAAAVLAGAGFAVVRMVRSKRRSGLKQQLGVLGGIQSAPSSQLPLNQPAPV